MPPPQYKPTLFERLFGGGHDINLPSEGQVDPVLANTPDMKATLANIGQGYASVKALPAAIAAGSAPQPAADTTGGTVDAVLAARARQKAFNDQNAQAALQGLVNAKGQ